MFQLLYPRILHALQPILAPICFLTIWASIVFLLWSIWMAAQDGIPTLKRLHQVPCANCQFFTGEYRLKCPLHPTFALTEEAIDCSDFRFKNRRV
ncbi:hypothetical protein G7B40_028250 [Aetokthonos hydrillicola Thurmond2011]|jgi:hypothetical protein|uniref:Uncharacterized protein n=1 Tax=Aetokthonos hydrillicola Thurmond2011 TaxID=2712845 RepID=A0AAP5IF39_9CYAN|nr:hypothetical protein [Aetokthonos hydrillicola]MBO3462453.1 hypothetical protein [Aetokthonos hydrillicola CCALA 1050]MBW4589853.1 hypothetical protein [Aetokthonos hydrillicola CCALA 1050]MDR9898423.1 hypothetical protein [Aetokthonos hydrillicola Thurmond2011]